MDKCFTDYMANQSRRISPAYPTETAAPSRFCVQTELVILLEIRHGHVSSSHYCTSGIRIAKIPEFRYGQKTGNSGIRKFRNCNHYRSASNSCADKKVGFKINIKTYLFKIYYDLNFLRYALLCNFA